MVGAEIRGGDRLAVVAAVSLLVLVVFAPLVGLVGPAQATAANNTTTTTTATTTPATEQQSNWSAPGPFEIDELKTGGEQLASEGDQGPPPSTRSLGTGGAIMRYAPVNPLKSLQSLEPGKKIGTDYLQLYSNAYNEATGEYQLVVVSWQQKSHNGTAYAANQSVQRINFEIEDGYATTNLKLASQYERTMQMTAWLEQNGERVEGARWRFAHQTNPLTASPAFPINGKGDLWRWAAMTLIFPAIAGLLVSGVTAKHMLERVIVGTQKGATYWVSAVGVIVGLAVMFATWQTTVVLANAGASVGILMGFIGLPIMLGIRDSDIQTAGFFQRLISEDAISPSGDETAGTRRVPNRKLDVVRRGDRLYAPKEGLRPMLARYWATPASIPIADMKSRDSGDEDSFLSELFEVDPEADDIYSHTAAHLAFAPTLFKSVDEDDLADPPQQEGIQAVPAAITTELSNFGTKINWRWVAITIGGGALVYAGAMSVFGSSLIAGALALVPGIVESYEARDGHLDVSWGPSHWNDVRAQVQTEREEYEERRTFDELLTVVTDMEWGKHEQATEIVDTLKTTIQEATDEVHGGGSRPPASTSGDSQPSGVSADD